MNHNNKLLSFFIEERTDLDLMSISRNFWRRAIKTGRPLWHRFKQFGIGLGSVYLLESTLIYYYIPSRGIYINLNDLNNFDINTYNNNELKCEIPKNKQWIIYDILSIFNNKYLGLFNEYFDDNIIIDELWYKWIGINELKYYKKLNNNLIQNPIITNVKVKLINLKKNNIFNSYGINERLIISFNSNIKNNNNNNEGYNIILILDLNKNGKIVYMKQLFENKPLITVDTNPIYGYISRCIRRANAFWYKMGHIPTTLSDI